MPTTNTEAENIVHITLKHVPSITKLQALFTELDEVVGKQSENDSVKTSFAMFRALIDHTATRMPRDVLALPTAVVRALLLLLVLCHFVLVLSNVAAACVAPFSAPWYIGIPVLFTVIWVTCSPVPCPLTQWENSLRGQLSMPAIGSFIGHYFLKPVYIVLTRMGLSGKSRIR